MAYENVVFTGDHGKQDLRYRQKNYIFPYFHQQYLVLFTMVPRNRISTRSYLVESRERGPIKV